jgi:hypothetical protein
MAAKKVSENDENVSPTNGITASKRTLVSMCGFVLLQRRLLRCCIMATVEAAFERAFTAVRSQMLG